MNLRKKRKRATWKGKVIRERNPSGIVLQQQNFCVKHSSLDIYCAGANVVMRRSNKNRSTDLRGYWLKKLKLIELARDSAYKSEDSCGPLPVLLHNSSI